MAGILTVLMLAMAMSGHAADPDTLYVRHIEGAVSLSEAGSPQAMDAIVNTPLIEGDTVATGPGGKMELFLKDGSIVRAGSNTVMKVIAVDDKGVQFKLEQGTAYIVSQGSKEVPLFFDTPLVSVDITSPSTVRIDAYSNGINEISVLKGGIFASQRSGRMLVSEGERLVLKADGSMPLMTALGAPDEWLRWNADRNARASANTGSSESYAYLPEELRTYSSDLDTNGQWIYTPEYEYVWVPTVITVGTWSPYRYGRWAWIRGSYVWVGYEPWGWAPYHYGRWVHHGQAGWCWVPPRHRDVRWEPAHVAWINSSWHVGWVPLAPGEHYDRRSAPVINRTNIYNTTYKNVTIERSAATAKTSYRNASVANSMITVESDRMLSRTTINVATANKGAAMLKKVHLPANVTPARAKDRQIPEMKTMPAARPGAAPSGVSGTAPKNIAVTGTTGNTSPSPVFQRPVKTRQLSDRSLNSRIENARTSPEGNGRVSLPQPVVSERKLNDARRETGVPNRDAARLETGQTTDRAKGQPDRLNIDPARKGTSAPPVKIAAPVGAEKTGMNGPAAKIEPKPSPIQPVNPKQETRVRNTTGTSPAPETVVRSADPNRASIRTMQPRDPYNPPPALPVSQVTRPVTGQPSPAVSAPAQTSRAPQVSRRPEAPREPVRASSPPAANQSRTVSSKTVKREALAPTVNPAPPAAAPAKPAPAHPTKRDNNSGPDKNNDRPHA